MAKGAWRNVLAKIAPGLGATLGGPLGGIAGKIIGNILTPGVDKPTDADLETAFMNATPEQLLALKNADREHIEHMKQLDIDVFKLETADVQSARSLFSVNYWPQITLSVAFIGGYFIILGFYLTGVVIITNEVKETANILIGIMSASVTAIMSFWFGSSFGSREKTAALAASAPVDGGK